MFSQRRPSSGWITLLASGLVLATLPCQAFDGNDSNFTYLALGDSVAFGLDVLKLPPFAQVPPVPSPDAFKGYPEYVADAERLTQSKKEVNASCPGETSEGFITNTGPDYGCHGAGPQGQPPFKTSIGLHTSYPGSQLDFAVSQLSTNNHINIVTLGIGSNDVLVLLAGCKGDQACVKNGLPAVLQAYAANLTTILTKIRANYTGTLVLVTYYSPSKDFDDIAAALRQIMISVGSQFHTRFADGLTAFRLGSLLAGGDPCRAGLLVRLPDGTCDIHPSANGQKLLGAAVEISLIGAPR